MLSLSKSLLAFTAAALLFSAGCTRESPLVPPQSRTLPPAGAKAEAEILAAERAYADSFFQPKNRLVRDLLKDELAAGSAAAAPLPIEYAKYTYFLRDEPGWTYPLLMRRPHAGAQAHTAFNPNRSLPNAPAGKLLALRIHPAENRCALLVELAGEQVLLTAAMPDGEAHVLAVPQQVYDLQWAPDGDSLYYTARSGMRAYALYRLTAGAPPVEIYRERNAKFFLELRPSSDYAMLFLYSGSLLTRRAFAVEGASVRELLPAAPGSRLTADRDANNIFLLESRLSPPDRLLKLNGGRPLLVSEASRGEAYLDLQTQAGRALLFTRLNGLPGLKQMNLAERRPPQSIFTAKEPMHLVRLHTRAGVGGSFRIGVDSPVLPRRVLEYDPASGAVRVHAAAAPGAPALKTEMLRAPSLDGTQIPITLVYRAGLDVSRPHPVLLTGYGAYGELAPLHFEPAWQPLLTRGVMLAVAHVRGGGEFGRTWHEQGRALHKERSFEDYLAAARGLIARRLTQPGWIAAYGRSAGGLLAAVAVERSPELFAALVLEMPFLDVPLSVPADAPALILRELDEWGDARQPEAKAYIERYAPLRRLPARTPPLYIRAGGAEVRTQASAAVRWLMLARPRAPLALLDTTAQSDHDGEPDRHAESGMHARRNVFILESLRLARAAVDRN